MVLLVATQIQLQSVAVYCIPLDSFSSKRQYASNTSVPVRLHAFQHISTPTGGDLNFSSLLSQRLSQSGKLVGALGGASVAASDFLGVATAQSVQLSFQISL